MQKACAYDVRNAPIHDLLIPIHKTRGFEWQTAHTKGCQENRCGLPSNAFLLQELMGQHRGVTCAQTFHGCSRPFTDREARTCFKSMTGSETQSFLRIRNGAHGHHHGSLQQEDVGFLGASFDNLKVCLMFSSATVFKLGENRFHYVVANLFNAYYGRLKPLFCTAMTLAHEDLRLVVMYVSEKRPLRRIEGTRLVIT